MRIESACHFGSNAASLQPHTCTYVHMHTCTEVHMHICTPFPPVQTARSPFQRHQTYLTIGIPDEDVGAILGALAATPVQPLPFAYIAAVHACQMLTCDHIGWW